MLVLPLALLASTGLRAQTANDTLNIRFRQDSIRVDMDFDGNARRWDSFEQRFRQNYSHLNPAALRLDIYAGASPEGSAAHNRWLGLNRGEAIRRLVRQRLGNAIGVVEVHNEGARWFDLYDRVAASDEPWRDEVLRIIELPASPDENQRDHREVKLRSLRRGSVWPVLMEKYLAPLRSGASATLTWIGGRDTVVVRETIVTRDTVVVQNTIVRRDTVVMMVPAMVEGTAVTGVMQASPEQTAAAARRDSIFSERLQYPAWAIKTNLLLWGVVAPNIEVELPLGRNNRWSVELEYFSPWFTWSHNAHASQFQNLGLELRLWLGNRKVHRWLQGWHIGLAGAVGYYDWEWKRSEGYQGEHLNTYLNLGYQYRWGRHWGFDLSIGAGYMVTKYRHYYGGSVYPEEHLEPWDEHLIYHDSGRFHWIGPCHASLSFVYLFNAWPFHAKSKKLKKYRENDISNNELNE